MLFGLALKEAHMLGKDGVCAWVCAFAHAFMIFLVVVLLIIMKTMRPDLF